MIRLSKYVLRRNILQKRLKKLKMSTHFSANQYDQAFAAQRLQNWEIPKKFKEGPSTHEGFTQPISNDRGHILAGIPRSSKSPWGEFIGTWDMKKPPLRTKTMKTNVMTSSIQNTAPAPEESARTPSPKHEAAIEKARTPTPQQGAGRTPSPRDGVIQERASPRPQSQQGQCKKSPSPSKQETPEPSASPGHQSAPQKRVVLAEPS